MALEAFSLVGKIALEGGAKVKKGLEGISGGVEDSQKRVANFSNKMGELGRQLGTVAKVGIAAAGAGVLALGGIAAKTGIQFNAMQEQSKVAWTTLLGGADAADTMIGKINEFAAATPFATENVDMMAKYMHNAGYEGAKMFEELTQISDVASAFAIPAAQAEEMARQMSQVQQAGVAYTEDLNVLADRGVPIFQALAEVTGENVAEVKKMASEGKITADIYGAAFDKVAGEVEGASEAQSKTFNGMISSLKDNLGMLAGELTGGLFERMKGWLEDISVIVGEVNAALQSGGIKEALNVLFPEDVTEGILKFFEDIKEAWTWLKDNWQSIVAGVTGIVAAFVAFQVITGIVTAFRFLNALMVAFRAGTVLATLAQWGFNAALLANPLTWIALLIGVLVAAVVMLWLNWDKVSKWLKESWTKIKNYASESFEKMRKSITEAWEKVKTRSTEIWNTFTSWIGKKVEEIRSNAETKFNNLKTRLTEIWEGIKTAIMTPIENAKTAVGDAIDWIKKKFEKLKLKLPEIKTPSFSIKNWSKNPVDWLTAMPRLQVDWRAQGGFLNGAQLIGAGEVNEAILPLENRKNMQPFSRAVAENLAQLQGISTNTRLEVPIVINGRELLRAIIPDVDRELRRKQKRQSGLLNKGAL